MEIFKTQSIRLENNELYIIDQQKLPGNEEWVEVTHPNKLIDAIKRLKVRGAPLIGVSAGLCLGLLSKTETDKEVILEWANKLRESRPTAVNLMNVIDRLKEDLKNGKDLLISSIEIAREDIELCNSIAEHGASLINDGDNILTHCNTGGLATAGIGTALGIITYSAKNQKKAIHVFVDETRPLLQGGRLTTWELEKNEIPYTLICDNMAGFLMKSGQVNKVFVGADRITNRGDFANKIGTYTVAALCHMHRVPFYVAAPSSTLDLKIEDGKDIPIEQRTDDEVRGFLGEFIWAPQKCKTWNPAFDVTPVDLVTGYILENGIFDSKKVKDVGFKNLYRFR